MLKFIWLAFLIDYILGDPHGLPHPVRFIGSYISRTEKSIRGFKFTEKELKRAGFFLAISTVTLTYFSAVLLLGLTKQLHIILFNFTSVILLWTTLSAKCLKIESLKVYRALKNKDIPLARKQLSYIVGRETKELDEREITKAAIETVVENTVDGVIAPLLYMFIGGAPLALAYKAVNTLDSMVGYKNEKYIHLGYASAKLDDLANYIPARITGILMILASGILGLNMKKSYHILKRDRKNHSSPNCGYPEAAAAGAMEIQLGGDHYYFGKLVCKPTIGDDKRDVYHGDIKTSNNLMYISSLLALMIFSMIFLV